MSLEEIMFYIDRTNFGHLNNEDKEEFVNTLIKNIDKSYIIDVTNSLLLSDFSTFKSIVKLMKEGYYKGLNCSRIYNLYEKLQPYISYESESAENIFKPLKTNDLISYDLNSIESLKLNSSIINDLISNLDVNFNNAITIDTSTEYFRDEECRIETQPCNVNVYLVE